MVQSLDDARRRSRQAATRVPPHNLQAEESLLGAMLLSRDAIAAAAEVCSADDFYKPAHAHIFDAITSLYAQGEPADPVTVADELRRADLLEAVGGMGTLISLQADTPATANASRYARIVEEHSLLRRLIGVAGEIAELSYSMPDDVEATLDRAEAMVYEVAERRVTDNLRPLRDLLEDSLDRLEALYGRGESITGVPTGYIDLDERLSGLQKSALVIVGARPAMGKCVAHDTLIVDPSSGRRVPISALCARGAAGRRVRVLSLRGDHRLVPREPSAFVDDGVKPVFRVRTRSGRQVRVTMSHPFLTEDGWRPLADLAVGARVAVPGRMGVFGKREMSDDHVALLAYLLCDGCSPGSSPTLAAPPPAVVRDLQRRCEAMHVTVLGDGASAGRVRLVHHHGPANPLGALLRRHGLWGLRPQARAVPGAIFELPRPKLALFLNRLFAAGGSVRVGERQPAVAARRHSAGGVAGGTAARPAVADYVGAEGAGAEGAGAEVTGDDAPGGGRRDAAGGAGGIRSVCFSSVSRRLVEDVSHLLLRFGVFSAVRMRSAAYHGERRPIWELEITSARDVAAFCGEIGVLSREGACAPSRPVGPGAADDIRWDEVVSITADGETQVYDLTVPGEHNFVAGDVIVHNTSFALGIAAHAAMHAQMPVLLFSLEMSHAEITQRLLCSEARVDATRVRNGRLLEADWPKISTAIGRLGEAPIFIDDNPNVSVMDIRGTARRLKSRLGNLGLIVIDYLQLMTGRRNAENRQVEISEISRGLKILARELEVPVLALSQLSRNLEMRADKRPMLADLRESGSLEQDSDVVMFIYRDEVYNPESVEAKGTAEIIVAKHRNGPTGATKLAFLNQYTRFENMARM